VKNIAFLMDKAGNWSLSPAFDVTYAYNPEGAWTARHQMTLNGRTENFTLSDFRECAKVAGLKRGRDLEILAEVVGAVKKWPRYANEAGVTAKQRDAIGTTLRLHVGSRQARTPQ
jgi:serine/threonine-protein kinase HipA